MEATIRKEERSKKELGVFINLHLFKLKMKH